MPGNAAGPVMDMGDGLDGYIAAANETATELLATDGLLISALRRYDEYFRRDLWVHVSLTPGLGTVLAMNAYMIFLAGCRMALSGHTVAVFPLLRTALESASYALIIEREPALSDVWSRRHNSDADRKACRQAFNFDRGINHIKGIAGDIHTLAKTAYEGAIDFGAHPNVKGVAGHLSIDEDRLDGNVAVTLTGLYSADHYQTLRGLFACLDFGLAIIGLIALTNPGPTATLAEELQALNLLKNEAEESYAPSQ